MHNPSRIRRAILAGLFLGLPELSAQVTMTLSAPVAGSVGYTTVPAGPLGFPQSFGSSNPGGLATLDAVGSFAGQVAATAFEFTGSAWASAAAWPTGFPSTPTFDSETRSIDVTFRLTFSSPTPFTGALRLQSEQSYSWYDLSIGQVLQSTSGSALTRIDVGGDGSFEAEFEARWGTNVGSTELPVSFQSTLIVDVVVSLTQTASAGSSAWAPAFASGAAGMRVSGELNDDYFAVQEDATTGATSHLAFDHGINGSLGLEIRNEPSSPTPMNGMFALGFQPVVIPLGPTVTQLVSADVLVMGGQANAILPLLPSGTELYVQGFGLDASGNFSSTRSLRILWL